MPPPIAQGIQPRGIISTSRISGVFVGLKTANVQPAGLVSSGILGRPVSVSYARVKGYLAGAWHTPTSISARVAGSWVPVTQVWMRLAGTWTQLR